MAKSNRKLLPPGYTPPERRDPPFWKVEKILRKHRGRWSFLFLLKWAVIKKRKLDPKKLDIPFFLNLVKRWHNEADNLYAIYLGLVPEMGGIKALSIVTEIYDFDIAYNEARKEKALDKFLVAKYGNNIPQRYLEDPEDRRRKYRELRSDRRRRTQQKKKMSNYRRIRKEQVAREKRLAAKKRRLEAQLRTERMARLKEEKGAAGRSAD